MSGVNNALGNGYVLFKLVMAGINHDRAVEAGLDAVVAVFLVAMVEVNSEDGLGINLVGGADHTFKEAFVGVLPSAFANLDDERRFAGDATFEQTNGLLEVVDVVSADGVFAIGVFE